VKYELVATTEAYGLYPKGSIWAEPDIDKYGLLKTIQAVKNY
jgi:hypothetical protein